MRDILAARWHRHQIYRHQFNSGQCTACRTVNARYSADLTEIDFVTTPDQRWWILG